MKKICNDAEVFSVLLVGTEAGHLNLNSSTALQEKVPLMPAELTSKSVMLTCPIVDCFGISALITGRCDENCCARTDRLRVTERAAEQTCLNLQMSLRF